MFPCTCMILYSATKPNRSMGTQEVVRALVTFLCSHLRALEMMGTSKGLCSIEGVPSMCCVSEYFGVVLACK